MHGLTLVLQQTLQKFFLDANILEKNTKVDKVAWIPLVTVKWCSWGKNPENYDTDNTKVLVIQAGEYSSGKNNGLIVHLKRLQNEW